MTPTCEHRDYTAEDATRDDGFATGPMCGKPARWANCDPVDMPACDEHVCRCRRALHEPSEAAAPAPNGKAAMHPGIARDPEAGAGAVASVGSAPADGLSCSFCSKSQREVTALIAAHNKGVHICDECISLCVDILLKRFRGCDEEGNKVRPPKEPR